MQTTLVVVRAFGPHAIGDLIAAASDVTQTLASEHAGYVVQMVPPSTPAPANPQPET